MHGRRRFLRLLAGIAAGSTAFSLHAARPRPAIALFLCGDVMPGRAIDQILPHPSNPTLHEPYMQDARGYLRLAEEASGDIPHPVPLDYIWGDALTELRRRQPAARIVNLESSITRSNARWPKGINYRMHPDNVGCLTAAHLDCCALANNHVLDWQRAGLTETLATLHHARIATTGAGANLEAAQSPAILPIGDNTRVLVFAAATDDAGVPEEWAATASRSGVHRLPDLSRDTAMRIATLVRHHRRAGDRVVFSLHWGGNWGYAVSREQRAFAHALIDEAGVDIVHGHSSHHFKAIEVYRDRPILYGCGDFLNDYEGIEGNEEYRGELGLMYFPTLDAASGKLQKLELVPTLIRKFRVNYAGEEDRAWTLARLQRECKAFGVEVDAGERGAFVVRWS